MPADKLPNLLAIFRRQHRTGDIGDATARLDQTRSTVKHFRLIFQTHLERARPHPPFRVRVAPPGPGPGAGRIDQHEIGGGADVGQRIGFALGGANLGVMNPGAGQPFVDRRELPLVAIGRNQTAPALHHGRQRQRLAAGPGAKVDHLLAGFCAGQQRRELRALVLNLDGALDEILLGVDAGIAGIGAERDPQAQRRPRRRRRAEMPQRGQHLLAFGLQRIDAQVERRAARHRRGFRRTVIAEDLCKMGIEPFRIIPGDMRGRIRDAARGQRRAFGVGKRFGREAAAVAQRRNRIDVQPPFQSQHSEQTRAGRVVVHDPGAGGLTAQHIIDQPRNRGAVAGAGETVRGAPFLQRFRGRHPLAVDSLDHFNGGGEPRGWRHG